MAYLSTSNRELLPKSDVPRTHDGAARVSLDAGCLGVASSTLFRESFPLSSSSEAAWLSGCSHLGPFLSIDLRPNCFTR